MEETCWSFPQACTLCFLISNSGKENTHFPNLIPHGRSELFPFVHFGSFPETMGTQKRVFGQRVSCTLFLAYFPSFTLWFPNTLQTSSRLHLQKSETQYFRITAAAKSTCKILQRRLELDNVFRSWLEGAQSTSVAVLRRRMSPRCLHRHLQPAALGLNTYCHHHLWPRVRGRLLTKRVWRSRGKREISDIGNGGPLASHLFRNRNTGSHHSILHCRYSKCSVLPLKKLTKKSKLNGKLIEESCASLCLPLCVRYLAQCCINMYPQLSLVIYFFTRLLLVYYILYINANAL